MSERTDDPEATARTSLGPSADPTAAFDLVADETRLSILQELADADAVHPGDEAVGFAELRERVGVRDSGRFNYHLGKLEGQFVRRLESTSTESDASGYQLTFAGWKVVTAVHEGAYATGGTEREGVEPCPLCGEPAETVYREGLVRIDCPEDHFLNLPLPAGAAAGRSLGQMLSAAMLHARQKVELAVEGVCSECRGRLDEPSLERPPDPESLPRSPADDDHNHDRDDVVNADERGDDAPGLLWGRSCGRCGTDFRLPPGMVVWRHPEVIDFHRDHEIDLLSAPPSGGVMASELAHEPGEVVSEDPTRVAVTVSAGDETLRVVVDDDCEVVRTERRPA